MSRNAPSPDRTALHELLQGDDLTRMERLESSAEEPDSRTLARAAEVMRGGGLVVFPTETFYGLGADPRNPAAVQRLIEAKGRPSGSPILLLLSGSEQARLVAAGLPRDFSPLAQRFWPGPLTLVVPAQRSVPESLSSGTGTIGLRVSGSPIARALARELGWPITGTSANRSGLAPPRTPAELRESLGESLDLVDVLIDAGPSPGGAPSTVVDITGARPRLIRAGAIPFDEILAALQHDS